jgi:hypothetical protein
MAEAFIRPAASGGAVMSSFDPETLEFFDSVELDLTASEDYTTKLKWTPHPVEDGSDITDNAVREPETATLTGVITQTPIVGGDASVDRLEQADRIFLKMARDRLPLQIITGLRVLDGYVITALTVSRSQTTGQTFNVSLDLQELITVEAQFAEVPPAPVKKKKKKAAGAAVDGGTKAPTDTTTEAEAGEGAGAGAADGDGEEDDTPKSVAAKSYDLAQETFDNLLGDD